MFQLLLFLVSAIGFIGVSGVPVLELFPEFTQLREEVRDLKAENIDMKAEITRLKEKPAPEKEVEEYVGCFKDAAERAMGGGFIRHGNEPVRTCIEQCRREGTTYAAIQDANACFCANKYDKYGQAGASECNSACPGHPGKCGAGWRNSVWKIVQKQPQAEKDTYVGCFKDSEARAMPGGYVRLSGATVDKCIARCRRMGTRFAGIQDSSACFCANEYDGHGGALESECNRSCPGNAAQRCGGPWRNSVWKID